MAKFKKGDVVQLKSGGPEMTISGTSRHSEKAYLCVWFINNLKKSDTFDGETLKPFNLTTENDE